MTVDGVVEPNSKILNEEHEHPIIAKRVVLIDANGNIINFRLDANKDFYFEVAAGNVPGHSIATGIGRREDFGPSETNVDIWNGPTDEINLLSSPQTIYVSSSNASDTQLLAITGLDENYEVQATAVILNGQNQVAVSGSWIRIFTATNVSGTVLAGDVYIAESDTLTDGVPNTDTKVLAKIDVGDEASKTCLYTIPANKTGSFLGGSVSVNRGINTVAKIRGRPFGGVFITRNETDIFENISILDVKTPATLPPKTDVKVSVTTDNVSTRFSATIGFIIVDV